MKRARAQASADDVNLQEARRGAVSADSARAIAMASLAGGFPVPAQLVELLGGEAAIAALEAEAKAAQSAAGVAGETSQEA